MTSSSNSLHTDALCTDAEHRALKAEELPSFGGFKLQHLKRQLTYLLGIIGRDKIFDQYTKHDITHINSMLRMLDWIIPLQTQDSMSSADWLMVVLSIYFHDFGMLVTPEEYRRRQQSVFPSFRDSAFAAQATGRDLQSKLSLMTEEDAERFMYQEFVRYKHAERIRNWLTGKSADHLGVSTELVAELDSLLKPLPFPFRRDLGLVCESHHLDDLYDTTKYKLSQPYGNEPEASVNLQYSAIILRTVDLLHISSDRTPSVEFRVISPTDPVSQREWAKQMGVISVRPKQLINDDGQHLSQDQQDTIEIYAFFDKADGFFGLTNYLSYAQSQISRSHDWAKTSQSRGALKYRFPWKKIDDSGIEAHGFLRSTFTFSIDQAKILELLTGHTIYNDTSVVLRELAQNSIDAVRLQELIAQERGTQFLGHVQISWDSDNRVLVVSDNGTGMTQSDVEQHLLRVGSSRYQSTEFRKRYSRFSPISRFGIGILSCFMIADEVEILTVHPDDQQARQLSLRSVHGRYLIRLLDKDSEEVKQIGLHGTQIRLRVRASAELDDVESVARQWLVMPQCPVTLQIDKDSPIQIGHKTLESALTDELIRFGVITPDSQGIKIEEHSINGISVAIALKWDAHFQEWSFIAIDRDSDKEQPLLGICIEGIRVEEGTPGFKGYRFHAMANAFGPDSPRTNVARSGLENTPELRNTLLKIYQTYCARITQELKELKSERSFSTTWATGEAAYLAAPLSPSIDPRATDLIALGEALTTIPSILVDDGSKRYAASVEELHRHANIWTVDSAFFRSADSLIREVGSDPSLARLIEATGAPHPLPQGLMVSNSTTASHLWRLLLNGRSVDKINIHTALRRVDLRWGKIQGRDPWVSVPHEVSRREETFFRRRFGHAPLSSWRIGVVPIELEGVTDEVAVLTSGLTFFVYGTPIAKHLQKMLHALETTPPNLVTESYRGLFAAFSVAQSLLGAEKAHYSEEHLLRMVNYRLEGARANLDITEFCAALNQSSWRIFDTSVWMRTSGSYGEDGDF